jgi:2-polyprenyl-3-methyl-5-hydroxy-6-metoxy-1,4-benzoquinol methylase
MPQCPLCHSEKAKPLWPVPGCADFQVELCPECGARFLSPQPSDAFLRQLYSQSYYDAWGMQEDTGSVRDMKLSTFAHRLALIKRYKTGGSILDVGCATGFFLEAARSDGFTPFGVEFSPYSSALARGKFGAAAVFEGILEDCPFPGESFDVMAMSDLLEHVRDPHALLAKSWELLKDDGVLMIMTPDTSSLTQRLMGANWVHYKTEHLFYFDPQSLSRLADRHGFRVAHREAAKKTLNLAYIYHQFETYRHWLLTPLSRMLRALLPNRMLQAKFNVTIGEMVVLLEKIPATKEQRS